MKQVALFVFLSMLCMQYGNAQSDALAAIQLSSSDIQVEHELAKEEYLLVSSANTFTYYNYPQKYEVILGPLVSQDFQSLKINGVEGVVYYFEYEKNISSKKDEFTSLIRKGYKLNKDHPEALFCSNNVFVVSTFPFKSEAAKLVSKVFKEKGMDAF